MLKNVVHKFLSHSEIFVLPGEALHVIVHDFIESIEDEVTPHHVQWVLKQKYMK